jgi:RNA polymerase sigma-70 factor (ECF subfamily)
VLTEAELIGIYREHMGPLYTYVSRRVGGDRTLAEDIVQDTWLRSVASWPRRGRPDHPRAWLIHVARNLLVSHFRRRRPHPVDPAEMELADDRCSPETPSAAALVNWGLARLAKRQAVLLEAFYFEGKSTREIAEACGLSERAIEGRLRRARQNLERHLKPYIDSGASVASVPEATDVPEPSEGRRNHD